MEEANLKVNIVAEADPKGGDEYMLDVVGDKSRSDHGQLSDMSLDANAEDTLIETGEYADAAAFTNDQAMSPDENETMVEVDVIATTTTISPAQAIS